MIGFTMLDPRGQPRWRYQPREADLSRPAHVDSAALLRAGDQPADIRLVLTGCNGEFIAGVTGDGRTLWENTGEHYESVQVGQDARGQPFILVDVDHTPRGESPVVVLDEHGRERHRWITNYSRHHCVLPADDAGHVAVLADSQIICRPCGEAVARLALEQGHPRVRAVFSCRLADDQTPTSLLMTSWNGVAAWIFRRDAAHAPAPEGETSGTGINLTNY